MPFFVGDLNEFYVNIGRVGADDGRDFYQFSRPVEGLLNISVQPLSAPVSVEILDNFGNVLSAFNASEENGG